MQYQFKIGAQDFAVQVGEQQAGILRVSVNGTPYDVMLRQTAATASQPAVAEPARQPAADKPAEPAGTAGPGLAAATGDGLVLAPIPGLILEVKVRVGDSVQAGQIVAVMEAMKMENNLTAHQSGVVKEILVQKGSEVATGDAILRIA